MKLEGGLRKIGISKTGSPEKPLISVVTVVFNGKDFLEQAIQSVVGQSYEPIEYIIVDGGSNDGTLDIIRKYEDRIDFWVSGPDEGIADIINKEGLLPLHRLIPDLDQPLYHPPCFVPRVEKEFLFDIVARRYPGF